MDTQPHVQTEGDTRSHRNWRRGKTALCAYLEEHAVTHLYDKDEVIRHTLVCTGVENNEQT